MERMFRNNHRINAFLLDTLSPDELRLSDGQGGESIFHLTAHLAYTRSWSVKSISPTSIMPLNGAWSLSRASLSTHTFLTCTPDASR